jgi:hypothetical protein
MRPIATRPMTSHESFFYERKSRESL